MAIKQTKNIFLVGLMGSGKSSLGRMLSDALDLEFYDSDQVIESKCGVSVSWIFDYEGEEGFRRREAQAIAELAQYKGIVLATGGGAILNEQNRKYLRDGGWVIYLQTNVDHLLNRLEYAQNRPLLKRPDRDTVMKELFEKRDPLYREIADLIIDTNGKKLSVLAEQILVSLEELGYPGN